MLDDVMNYFPESIKKEIAEFVKIRKLENQIEEIRFRTNRKVSLKIGQDLILLNYIIMPQDIDEIYENICEKSIYSYTKQISEGFITIKGGNRVGITGSRSYRKRKNNKHELYFGFEFKDSERNYRCVKYSIGIYIRFKKWYSI